MNNKRFRQSVPRGWGLWLAASREALSERLVFGVLAATSLLAVGLAFAPMAGLGLGPAGARDGGEGAPMSNPLSPAATPTKAPINREANPLESHRPMLAHGAPGSVLARRATVILPACLEAEAGC
ncbi:MAG: hypothetical protein C5B50_26990 [Verrucomicrobia bacterium]|nr:MAG: hypothetical protein C5B50_26990 [Verrucomicrobiota bacterium]